MLWQEGEGNQIYGNERLYSKGAQAKTTTYVYGLNNSVYATISSINDKDYIQKNKYDDYGQKPGIGNGYGYNGEFRDESELIYLRARYYNPKIARFIQIDSFKGDIESIQSQNRYVYTHNNPYKYTDPSGNNVFDRFIENLKKLNEQKEKNKVSLVEDADYERKRDTKVKNGTWKSPYPYQKKPGPYNYIKAFYKAPCPPVSNKIADGVRGFLNWLDGSLRYFIFTAGIVAAGLGVFALCAAAIALLPSMATTLVCGISLQTLATAGSVVSIISAEAAGIGSIIYGSTGTMGYKLDGTRLSQEEAKQRIIDSQYAIGLSFMGMSFSTLALGLVYISNVRRANNENTNNNNSSNDISNNNGSSNNGSMNNGGSNNGNANNGGAHGDSAPETPKPVQIHHFASNKNQIYTARFEEIIKKYGLKLDQDWNRESLPHLGRHPNAYHEFVLKEMKNIDLIANGDKNIFLKLYESNIKNIVRNNPDMLDAKFWKN